MPTSPTSGPGGGGSGSSVGPGCVLRVAALDVAAFGTHTIKWDSLHDNLWDFNVLASLPAGLGLTVAFDGSNARITTTAAGFWSFAYAIEVNTDATWLAHFYDNIFAKTNLAPLTVGGTTDKTEAVPSYVLGLPSGAIIDPYIITDQAATGALTADIFLSVVRLG